MKEAMDCTRKFVNESIEDLFKPKTDTEIRNFLEDKYLNKVFTNKYFRYNGPAAAGAPLSQFYHVIEIIIHDAQNDFTIKK